MDKVRKNLLGRTVSVKKEAKSDGSLAKTRTVTSKKGGVISSKTSYKDAGSLAGKMQAAKDNRAAKKDERQTLRGIKQMEKGDKKRSKMEQKIKSDLRGYEYVQPTPKPKPAPKMPEMKIAPLRNTKQAPIKMPRFGK